MIRNDIQRYRKWSCMCKLVSVLKTIYEYKLMVITYKVLFGCPHFQHIFIVLICHNSMLKLLSNVSKHACLILALLFDSP